MTKIKVGVIGSGMIGAGLASLFTGNGYDTVVVEVNDEAISNGIARYEENFALLQSKGLLTSQQIDKCRAKVSFTTDYRDMAEVSVIMECCPEALQIKRSIYENIQAHCLSVLGIASTSSAIAPDDLAGEAGSIRGKIMVAHPFNPPHIVPFVELVRSKWSTEESVQAVFDLLEDCGRKVCIMEKAAPGFIANRLQHALAREAIYMVEQGMASARDIDKALMYSFMPRYTSVGLFEHFDAAGQDLIKNIHDYLLSDLSNQECSFDSINELVAKGDLGQKTGKGMYEWDNAAIDSFKERTAEPYWKYFNWKLPE